MILINSSVLSILTKVDRLDLLFVVLGDDLAVAGMVIKYQDEIFADAPD